jgi:uncharacterized protein YgbK (DUF1537 family)
VLEALMDELDCRFTIATPAFPDNGRTVFKGHLFVGDVLLSESGMRNHPLTPMTDANLVRVLQAQLATTRGGRAAPRRVGLVDHRAVGASSAAIVERFAALEQGGVAIAIADAVANDDLLRLGAAVKDLPLVCAGSGWRSACRRTSASRPRANRRRCRRSAAFARSSPAAARRRPTARWRDFLAAGGAAARSMRSRSTAATMRWSRASAPGPAQWARRRAPVLVYSTAAPQAVAAAQAKAAATTSARASSGSSPRVAAASSRRRPSPHRSPAARPSGSVRAGRSAVSRLRIGAQIDPGRAVVPCRAGARRRRPAPWR